MKTIINILCVEDELQIYHQISESLNRLEVPLLFESTHVSTLKDAIIELKKNPFDAILLDLYLPDSSELDTMHRITLVSGKIPIIILIEQKRIELALNAFEMGAQDILLVDAIDSIKLKRALAFAVERKKLQVLSKKHSESEDILNSIRAGEVDLLVGAKNDSILRLFDQKLVDENEELLQKLKKSNDDLEIKAEELALASKYKSEFLANMSHELRTPLNSFLILSKNLMKNKRGNLDPDQIEDLAVIREGGKDLLNLINDIMDLSKVEAGMLSVEIEEVAITTIVGALKRLFEPIALSKGIHFEISCDKNLPTKIISDSLRLEQILKNFLSNAFKFTEKGTVSLNIHVPGDNVIFKKKYLTKKTSIAFSVVDNGIGIANDKRNIFEAFQQEDGSITRKYGGTGLGLSISKQLTHLLGGEIHYSSEQGKGSTFTLHLPIKIDRAAVDEANRTVASNPSELKNPSELNTDMSLAQVTHSIEDLLGKPLLPDDRSIIENGDSTLLIIGNNEGLARSFMRIGRENGFKCLVVGTGRSGLYLAMKFIPTGILLDTILPDIASIEVFDQLKYHLRTRHIPVYLSSEANEELPFLNRGAIAYLPKPVSDEKIAALLSQISRTEPIAKVKLHVVGDDERFKNNITSLFSQNLFSVTFSNGFEEGWSEIINHKNNCIIVDMNHCDFDGLKALEGGRGGALRGMMPPIIFFSKREFTKNENEQLIQIAHNTIVQKANSILHVIDYVAQITHIRELELPKEYKQAIHALHDQDAMLQKRRVLLVESDMRSAYTLSKQLSDVGLNIIKAQSGLFALEKVKNEHIELILLDIKMPKMDGYEVMRCIRKMNVDIPIIALTANAIQGEREKCLAAGASDFLVKPIDVEMLLIMLRVWLFHSK